LPCKAHQTPTHTSDIFSSFLRPQRFPPSKGISNLHINHMHPRPRNTVKAQIISNFPQRPYHSRMDDILCLQLFNTHPFTRYI
jgi:hypothetical protein